MINICEIQEEFTKITNKAIKHDLLVVDYQLQEEMVKVLELLLQKIKGIKKQAINNHDEKNANHLFYMQCCSNAIICSLKTWINLKNQKPVEAWHKLIDAQEYLYYALKVKINIPQITAYLNKLKNIEYANFPQFTRYLSASSIIEGGQCSVCGKDFDTCEHIEEMVYCGIACKRVNPKILECNHVALVENPEDRRCIITEFEMTKGKIYDYITLKFIRDKKLSESEHAIMKAVIYSFKNLDVF